MEKSKTKIINWPKDPRYRILRTSEKDSFISDKTFYTFDLEFCEDGKFSELDSGKGLNIVAQVSVEFRKVDNEYRLFMDDLQNEEFCTEHYIAAVGRLFECAASWCRQRNNALSRTSW